MKNNGQKDEIKNELAQPSLTQPSPDNQGIELEKNPKSVDEAAAEANRDVPALLKIYPNKKKNVRKRIPKSG
jgi:hypothetical protein